ncbi:MAG: helix-turn-helix domain-containing protein [Campylobacterota bacterium]|nr:helix-turn-helix domain-containing protein [Campylobacterota bacterium]
MRNSSEKPNAIQTISIERTTTDYNSLLPKGVIFNLAEIQDMKAIKISTAKKLISNGEIETVKIGNKIHVSRIELVRFLESNTSKY